MARVVALIVHAPLGTGAGPLERLFEAIRHRNARRQQAGFAAAGAETVVDDQAGGATFGERIRRAVARERPDGLILLGSGSVPLATAADRRAFVAAAGGSPGRALVNNRFSADVIALAGVRALRDLPELTADNGLPRWLARAGVEVDDLSGRWRLQVDLDSPLDALIAWPRSTGRELRGASVDATAAGAALERIAETARDPAGEVVVAGRTSARALAWLERRTASRTRALVEERGFRTRAAGQRPVRSSLGLLLDRDGPDALGPRVAELGDAALIDSRVLIAHRFGADERAWPRAEDRFASDLLLPDRIDDPWLRALTRSARDAPVPIVLGGHTLVGPGVRLVLGRPTRWT